MERHKSRERREMKQAIIDLAAAVKELAAAIKEGKEENSPTPPIRRKPKKPTTTTTRAREKFLKPTVDRGAAGDQGLSPRPSSRSPETAKFYRGKRTPFTAVKRSLLPRRKVFLCAVKLYRKRGGEKASVCFMRRERTKAAKRRRISYEDKRAYNEVRSGAKA